MLEYLSNTIGKYSTLGINGVNIWIAILIQPKPQNPLSGNINMRFRLYKELLLNAIYLVQFMSSAYQRKGL